MCVGVLAMKKRYNLMLDKEAVDRLQAWLKSKGISFSGYMNSILNENVKTIEILDGVTDLKDISIGQLNKIYAGMAGELQKSKTSGKVKKVKK
jgi:hypothetical protein